MENNAYPPRVFVQGLEIPLSEHCNLKCKGCSHHSPYLKPHFYDYDQFVADIDALKDVYHTTKVSFLGGEPLLNRQINKYIAYARQAKIADIFAVITNGLLLKAMDDEFYRLVDQINISLYPNIGLEEGTLREFLAAKAREFKFVYNINTCDYFQNTETEELSAENAQNNFTHCSKQKNLHTLYEGYYYRCNRPVSTKQFLERNGDLTAPDFKADDGVRLAGPELYARLHDYVNRTERLSVCYYCLNGFIEQNAIDGINFYFSGHDFIRRAVVNNKLLYAICLKIKALNKKYKQTHKCKTAVEVTQFEHQQLNRK